MQGGEHGFGTKFMPWVVFCYEARGMQSEEAGQAPVQSLGLQKGPVAGGKI